MGLVEGQSEGLLNNMIARLVFIGFSGTGKSSVGRLVANRLGWDLLDMDDEIERREGISIPNIFVAKGEPAFREMEREVFLNALARDRVVISTGGGAVCNEPIWDVLRGDSSTFVVGLDAPAECILERLDAHAAAAPAGQTTHRPMLRAEDPLERIIELKSRREEFYGRAHVTIPVGNRAPETIASDLEEMFRLQNGEPSEVSLELPMVQSRILVGRGTRDRVMDLIHERWPKAQTIWAGVDAAVHEHHRDWLEAFDPAMVRTHDIPSGEASKSIAGLGDIYDWMLGGGVERGDVVIAAGGGVTGDLMGFAAATVLRGIGLVQMPTTLLAMVDSSVGGKTGINHPQGKNLIGAFYQPSIVAVDPGFLDTLPERELRSGFAEVIKHGMIQASTPMGESGFLLDLLRHNAPALARLEDPLTSWVIRQNISLKAAVVAEDEKESQLRAILNFGHTIGHGIEAAGYSLLHGEAIAVGMVAAMAIGVEKGLVDEDDRRRLMRLVETFGLPTSADVDVTTVRQKMARDKKKSSGVQKWVMPIREGGVEVRTDVSDTDILAGLRAVLVA